MEHRCESCGQDLPHEHASDDSSDQEALAQGILLGAPGENVRTHRLVRSPTHRSAGKDSAGKDKRMLLGLLAALLAWGAFVGVGRLIAPDSTIDEQAAAVIEERAASDAAADTAIPVPTERPRPQGADDPALGRDRGLGGAAGDGAAGDGAALDRAALDRAALDRAALDRAADVEGDYAAADAAPGFPVESAPSERFDDLGGVGRSLRDDFIDGLSLGARVAASFEVDKLMGEFARRSEGTFVAYRSANGVVLVDLAQGSAEEIEVGPVATTPLQGAHLLRSGPQTFAIDPSTLDIARIANGSNPVVADSRDGSTYTVDLLALLDHTETVIVVTGGVTGSLDLPIQDMQLMAVDGLGLLAVPRSATGESLIATPDGFVALGPNRVVTGSESAVLEQVCSRAGGCRLEIVHLATGERTPMPDSFVRFGDSYTVSPDGGSILRRSADGFAELFLTEADEAVVVAAAGMQHAAWGPNSDVVAWLDDTGEPMLKIMFVTEREWLTIELQDLGAPAPASPELTVFAVASGEEEPRAGQQQAGEDEAGS